MRHAKGWLIPAEDMPSMLQLIQEKISSSEIEARHRDVLIRLQSILESDLATLALASEKRVEREGERRSCPARTPFSGQGR
jgi:hypothetical protein